MATKYAIETAFRLIDEISRPLSKITGNTKATSRALKSLYVGMENSTARLGKSLSGLGSKLAGAFGLAGILNINKIAGFLTKDIKNVIEFQTAIAKVGTVADAAAVPLDKLSKQITEVSTRTGVASNQIAESAYAAITAGISTEKAVGFVEVATKAAIGGFTDEATAIDALTSVINAYGLQAGHEEAIADRMLLTQNLGKTSFNDMAQAMGKVVPYASQLGVTLNELFASITTLTGSGSLKTADAMSSMKTMLTSVINPGKEAAETAKQLGIDFSASALQSKGLVKFLQEITDAAGDNQAVMGKLFGADKADMAVRILTSTGKDVFLGAMDAMRNSAGATEEAFQKMMDTPEKRWGKAMNTLRNAGISFGTAILPVTEQVIGKISAFADSVSKIDFSQFRGAVESVVGVVSFLAGALVWAVKTAWAYRGVIIAVGTAIVAFFGIGALLVGTFNLITETQKTASRVTTGLTIVFGDHAKAVERLTGKKEALLFVETAYELASKARLLVVGLLTRGMATEAIAAASLAVANGTATTSQWLLNAAMSANPIGLVVIAIAALVGIIVSLVKWGQKAAGVILLVGSIVGMIVLGPIALLGAAIGFLVSGIFEVLRGWRDVGKAFNDGGVLGGLRKIGGLLLSGIIGPIQGLMEVLSHLPGIGDLFGKGAEKLAGLRNSLRQDEAIVTKTKSWKIERDKKEKEAEEEEAARKAANEAEMKGLMDEMGKMFDGLDFKGTDVTFDVTGAAAGAGSGGKNPLHGVYDISGGAPSLGAGSSASASGGASAGRSVEDTAREAVGTAVSGILSVVRKISVDIAKIASWTFTPSQQLIPASGGASAGRSVEDTAREAVGTAVAGILSVVRKISVDITKIASWTFTPSQQLIPAPVTAGERTAYALQEQRETVKIELRAAKGTEAEVKQAPPQTKIRLIRSGRNAYA